MFGSQALETVIGLVFFFLAISIFVTSVQEFIATALALRSNTLNKGLQQLVGQGQDIAKLGMQLLDHPNISPSRAKAYVSSDDFCSALVDVLAKGDSNAAFADIDGAIANLPDGPLKLAASAAATRAQGSVQAFEKQVAAWFDNSMETLSSRYKRLSAYLSLGLGGLLAFGFNLNAIQVVKALWVSDALREQAVAVAAAEVAKGAPGANYVPTDYTLALFGFHVNFPGDGWAFSGVALFGCAITMFAVSLGAPFWFDILQNVLKLNVRGTGAKPERADA